VRSPVHGTDVILAVARNETVDPDPPGRGPHRQEHNGKQCVEGAHARYSRHHVREEEKETANRRQRRKEPEDQRHTDRKLRDSNE
jgi:hypothetical protein